MKRSKASISKKTSGSQPGKEDDSSSSIRPINQPPKGIEDLTVEKCSAENPVSLQELVKELKTALGYDRERILKRLVTMEEERKIRLVETQPFVTFASYLVSPFSLWFWAATFATILSFSLIFVSSGLAIYLRYVFGGLLILFLPGFALIELLYAKKSELESLTRIALSIGLSLALVPLVGLVLNYTPFGIRLIPIAISLTALTIILLSFAIKRKHTYYKISKELL